MDLNQNPEKENNEDNNSDQQYTTELTKIQTHKPHQSHPRRSLAFSVELRSRTRDYLSPSRHPFLSSEKCSRWLLISLSVIFSILVLFLSVYYIYNYFEFHMTVACRYSRPYVNETIAICSKKT